MEKEENMDRRKFLKDGLKIGIGIAAGISMGNGIALAKKNVEELPYPYVKLDPKKVADKAYEGYYKGECAYGVFSSIIDELKVKVGAPYTGIPSEIFHYGGGGVAGWGTVCGALNAAAAIFNLTCKDFKKMIDTLYQWYQTAELPDYVPSQGPFCKQPYPKSVSQSPLCHVSVQRWCKVATIYYKEDVPYKSKRRSERCARLSASVARKVVEMLNEYHFGKLSFTKVKESEKTKMDCKICHEITMKGKV